MNLSDYLRIKVGSLVKLRDEITYVSLNEYSITFVGDLIHKEEFKNKVFRVNNIDSEGKILALEGYYYILPADFFRLATKQEKDYELGRRYRDKNQLIC